MPLLIRSDVVSIDPSVLKEIAKGWRPGQDYQVAIVALLIYDAVVTFDKEVRPPQLDDSCKLTFAFVSRSNIFGNFRGDRSALFTLWCNFSLWTATIANWVTIISIDYILMIRVIALYSQDKALSIFLKALLALEAAFKLGLIVYLNISQHIAVVVYANVSVCATSTVPAWQLGMVAWLVPLVYGTLLMILALYKAAEYWRLSAGFRGFTLVKVLIEDQAVYFVLAISFSVLAILSFKLSDSFLYLVLIQLGNPAFFCLLGSRMLFNLKEAGERGQNEGTSYWAPQRIMSSLDFVEPVNHERESGETHFGREQIV